MNSSKNEREARLDRIVAQIRDEHLDPAVVRAAGDRILRNLAQERTDARADAPAGEPLPDTIRGCADVRALLPSYVAGTLSEGRAMLVGDHTRECVGCRRALIALRAGSPESARSFPSKASRPFPALRWVAAAAVVMGAVLAGTFAYRNLPVDPERSAVHVRSVDGALYRITGNWSSAVSVGEEIAGGQVFRTAKGSRAVVRLADGSDVEMNERSELSISARRAGTTLHLSRGSIIVQASDQGSQHLFVATSDCRVAVTGTIFAVNHGTKGSRVSVIEGEVHVERPGARDVLHPGDQVSTSASLGRVPLSDEIAWSRDANSHLALLAELTDLKRELAQIPHPAVRHDTRLLDLAPSRTVVYAAIPNVGSNLAEAHRVLRDRLEHSPVLQEWWSRTMAPGGADGEIDDAIEWVRRFSEQLKDEIVITLASGDTGNFDGMLALAELSHPAEFPAFLSAEIARIPVTQAHPGVRILEDPASAMGTDGHDLLVWVHGDLLAVSPSLAALRTLQSEIASGATSSFAGSTFRASLARSYQEGTSFLLGVDLESILARSSAANAPSTETLRNAGLLDVRHLVVEGKETDGTGTWRAALSFGHERRGIASWLAAPAPMGSLEFISPDATVAAAFVTKDPVAMATDLLDLMRNLHPECAERLAAFEKEHGVDVLHDLAAPLGGEFALALDGPILPTPAWRAIFEVYDAPGLQHALEWIVAEANRSAPPDHPLDLRIDREDAAGRTWYAIRSARFSAVEVDYAFVDGYLVAAPSRSLVEAAIATRSSGAALPESSRFTDLLPRDGEANFSVIAYQNLTALASTPSPEANDALRRLLGGSGPSLAYAYGEPDRIVAASMRPGGLFGPELGMFFGLDSLVSAQRIARQIAEQHAAPGGVLHPMSAVIEIAGLTVRLGGRPILKGIDASLSGKAIGLLGPNGAGKTTLLHTLLGFYPPAGGTVRLLGLDLGSSLRDVRRRVGYMPENDAFIAGMTAVRFVRLLAELSGLPSSEALERAHEALFYVGLGEARYRRVETYSLGMKQMAKLAQAIAHGPDLVFLDEPTNGLDPPHRERMLRLIREIRDRGVHVVISSHLLRDVEETCDEVIVLKEGRVAALCNLEEERRTHRRFLELEARGDHKAFARAVGTLGCEVALQEGGRMKMVLPAGIEVRDLYRLAAESSVQIRRLNSKRDSLQDIFLKAMETNVGSP